MGNFSKDRENIFWGFVGDKKTGKSTAARKIALAWKRAKPSYYSVVAFDPQQRFKDIADYFITAGDEDWALKLHKFRNCLVILDDYRLINKPPVPVRGLEYLISQSSYWNIDIIYICHNPALILNYFTYFTNRYFIFQTNSREGAFEKKIPNYSLCIAAARKVNDHVHKYGRGQHPNFPHCIVLTEERRVKAINMSRNVSDIKLRKHG